jgi:sialic acid synthase SpsE
MPSIGHPPAATRRPEVGSPSCFVIAEIGSNHNRDLAEAHRLIGVAAAAGCNAAKFQTYSADTLYSRRAPRLSEMDTFVGDDGRITPYELISTLELPRAWHGELAAHCREAGIEFMSTPFDVAAVEELDPLVARHKLASYDLTNRELVRACAATGRPLILSTGHAFLGEVEESLAWVREVDEAIPVLLLHCTSRYPTPFPEVNLRVMATLAAAFDCAVGLSDHTLGLEVPVAAAALGAAALEKHITGDRTHPGPDHAFALEPGELTAMVAAMRNVEAALGSPRKQPTPGELENRLLARRSIHLVEALPAGTAVEPGHLAMLRPGTGIRPADVDLVLGRRLRRHIEAGEPLTWEAL